MASPSHSKQEEDDLQTQKPNPTHDEENEHRGQQQQPLLESELQSAETKTLETPDPQNPEPLEVNPPQNQHQTHTEGLLVLDQEEEDDQDPREQSGMSVSPPRPAFLEQITVPELEPNPLSLTSPTNPRRNKRKKGGRGRNFWKRKKVQILTHNINPIPFIPSKPLDFEKHEELLKHLGLWDFVHIEFDRNIRVDLLAELIVNYDSRKRCSYVNDFRIQVSRPVLGRCLKLPAVKMEKNSVEEVDLDSEAFPEESISFLDDFVSNWVLLHEETWMMPGEVLNWRRVIKDGHPEKVDWAGLVWYMVEKELTQGDKLRVCYYASHLQYLIKSHRDELFKEDDYGGDGNVKEEENDLVEEPNIELNLGQGIAEHEEVKNDDMMDVEECKEEEQGNWLLDGKNNMGKHFLQCCASYDERKLEEEEEEEEGEEEEKEVEEREEEEKVVEEREDGFDIGANDDTLDRHGLTGNLLQGMETTQIPSSSQEELPDMPSVELFASRDDTYIGGPSFFGNASKRVIEPEHDISHHSLNVSNTRLRTDGMWDHKSSDFGMRIEQMQQLMTQVKMIYETKEQTYESSHMHQQYLISELQQQQSLMELLRKSKDEEVERKHAEIIRLERELYLMADLIEGYRKALKESDRAFSEYRQRYPLPEEPLYMDAGPGGLVLSIRELEKQRQKQEEEDRMKLLLLEHTAKDFEEVFIGNCNISTEKVEMLDSKLVYLENEVKRLKEFSAQRMVRKCEDGLLENDGSLKSPPSDATQVQDALLENDGSLKTPSDATESQDALLENDGRLKTPSDATESQDALLENDGSLKTPCDATELQEVGL